MMKPVSIFFFAGIFVAACTSSNKKTEAPATTGVTAASEADSDVAPEPKMPVTSTELEIGKGAADDKSSPKALDEAIKSQNDERIHKAATLALLQNPQDTKALNALALYNYKHGKHTAAKYLLEKAIALQPAAGLYNNLGVVHLAHDEQREALLAFRQAVSLDPQDGVAAANIGSILVGEKNFAKAVTALEIAYQKGYRDIRVINNYAIALTAQGKGTEAVALYEKALREQSNNKEVLFNYSVLLIDNLKRFKEGSEILGRLKFVGVPPEQRNRIKDLENKVKVGLQ